MAKSLPLVVTVPYVVLVGTVGSGKTYLSTKLAMKENTGVSHFGSSATRVSTIYRTKYFEFSDTPGYRSRKNKLNHAVNIICALQYKPVSRIFILSKYECRVDQIVNNAKDIIVPFLEQRCLITLIITAWDLSDRGEDTKQQILDAFHEDFNIDSIIFTEKDMKSEDLKKEMQSKLGKPQKIDIPAKKISKFFDISKNDHKIIEEIRASTESYLEIVKATRDQANSMEQGQEKEDFVFFSQSVLLEIQVQMKEEFIDKYLQDVTDPEEFACLDQFHVQLHAAYKSYRDYCRQFIKDITAGVGTFPLRKCPFCGLVWTKVSGCDGETTCGNRPENTDRAVKSKWTWSLTPGKITFQLLSAIKDQLIISTQYKTQLVTTSAAGCGRKIAWKDMQPVTVPPEILEVPVELDPPAAREEIETKVIQKVESALNEVQLCFDSAEN